LGEAGETAFRIGQLVDGDGLAVRYSGTLI
jgi:hypothetical protein